MAPPKPPWFAMFRGIPGASFGDRRQPILGKSRQHHLILCALLVRLVVTGVTFSATRRPPLRIGRVLILAPHSSVRSAVRTSPAEAPRQLASPRTETSRKRKRAALAEAKQSGLTSRTGFAFSGNRGADLNPLSIVCIGRNGDMEMLDLLAASGEAHFQFEMIVGGRIRFRPIERDQGGKFSRQALFDVGRFERRAAHGDVAVFGRNGEPDRRQRTGGAIGSHAGVDADAHIAPERRLYFAID